MTRSTIARAAAAALVGGLLAAGCGSGDDADTASPKITNEAGATTAADSSTTADGSATTAPDSGGDEGSKEEDGGACDIVSDDVAAKVLGIEIVRREPHAGEGGKGVSCIKGTERVTDLSKSYYVSAAVIPGGSALVDEASGQAGSVPVEGLGDKAVFLTNAGALFIADGADTVSVQVVKAGKPGTQQDAVTVARDVLGRR